MPKTLFDIEPGPIDAWYYERLFKERGLWPVAGVDEVGRGCLAGPVVAASVILQEDISHLGITDSKRLTPKERQGLLKEIEKRALAISVSSVPPEKIDKINILKASLLAMKEAVGGLSIMPRAILIDGNKGIDCPIPQRCIVKGDSLSCSISAASIVAKVYRDNLMVEYAQKYPDYGFERHKGYATSLHKRMLKRLGPCPIHRMTFRGVRAGEGD